MHTLDIFPVGTTFAPTALATDVPPSEWEQDVATMKSLGLNIYRLFVGWDRIERRRGVYDFSRVDHSFRLAEKYGLRIIVNLAASGNDFPGPYAPRWLYRELDVSLRRSDPGAGNRLTRTEYKLCYDDDRAAQRVRALHPRRRAPLQGLPRPGSLVALQRGRPGRGLPVPAQPAPLPHLPA
jgi:hypothetical protein